MTDHFNGNTKHAENYLKLIGKWREFSENKTSLDGWTLLQYANHYAEKANAEQKAQLDRIGQ